MRGQRGQAAVEWTGLLLLVVVVLAGAATAAHGLGAGGLPERLTCAIAGDACTVRPAFAAGTPLPEMRARLGVRRRSGWPGLAMPLVAVPAASALEDATSFVWRHRRTVRKVLVATAVFVLRASLDAADAEGRADWRGAFRRQPRLGAYRTAASIATATNSSAR